MPYAQLETMPFAFPALRRRAFGVVSTVSVLGVALAGAHCSSKGGGADGAGTSCQSDPTVCAPGETCWPVSPTTLTCLASLKGTAVGAACVEAYDHVTCGDGMLCDSNDPSGKGQCAQYCGPTTPCPAGYECDATQVGSGATVDLCRVAPPGMGGADGGDASTGDEGTDEGAVELPDIYYIPDVALDVGPAHQ
jgi:hypothetical protein